MKDVPRQRADTEEVIKSAKYGTPRGVVQPKKAGAWAHERAVAPKSWSFDNASECNTLVPAKSA